MPSVTEKQKAEQPVDQSVETAVVRYIQGIGSKMEYVNAMDAAIARAVAARLASRKR